MNDPDLRKTKTLGVPRRRWRVRNDRAVLGLAAALLSIAIVAVTIQSSMRRGRLALIPVYDDIYSMRIGAQLLHAWYEGGMASLVKQYLIEPPHSPYTALLCTASYAMLGIEEWTGYASNIVQVGVFFTLLLYLLRGLPLGYRLAGLVMGATTPLMITNAHELKPDFVAGVITSAFALIILRRPFFSGPRRTQWLAGILCGLAYLVKPSIFAQTALLTAGALGLGFLADLADGSRRPSMRQVLGGVARICLATVLIAGPHFSLTFARIWHYMWLNMFGASRDLWQFKGDTMSHVLFYLTGKGSGAGQLGPHLWIAGALMLIAVGVTLMRGVRREIVRMAALAAMLGVAYALPTLNPMKNIYVGLTFQNLFVMSGVASLALLLSRRSPLPRSGKTTVVLLCVLASVATYQVRNAWYPLDLRTPGVEPIVERRAVARTFMDAICDRAARGANRIITLNGNAMFTHEWIQFEGVRRGIVLTASNRDAQNPQDYAGILASTDQAVCSEIGTGMVQEDFPESKRQNANLAYMNEAIEFRRALVLTTPGTDKHFVLFERIPDGELFSGTRPISGLLPVEGPYPQWSIRRMQWATFPEAKMTLTDAASDSELRMLCEAHLPGQVMTILLDDREIAKVEFAAPFQVVQRTVPLTGAAPNSVITFKFSVGADGPDARRSVQFRVLRVVHATK